MRHLAIAVDGDQRFITSYHTNAGYHQFQADDGAALVRERPAVRPSIITDLGHVMEPRDAPLSIRGTLKRWWRHYRHQTLTLRVFHRIGEGWIEIPCANMEDGVSLFWKEIVARATKTDATGRAVWNDEKVFDADGNQMRSLDAVSNDLARLGLRGVDIQCILQAALHMQSAPGHDAVTREAILAEIIEPAEGDNGMAFVAAYLGYLGFEIGAKTPFGAMYAQNPAGDLYMIGFVALLGIAYFLTRRKFQ